MEPLENLLRSGRRRVGGHVGENSAVPWSQISWLTTVALCLIAAVLVLINGYLGYFGVLLAVAAAAAINLRRT